MHIAAWITIAIAIVLIGALEFLAKGDEYPIAGLNKDILYHHCSGHINNVCCSGYRPDFIPGCQWDN